MFNDNASRLVEQFNRLEGRVSIGNVVERQLFTLQLLGGRNRSILGVVFNVEGRFLMWILTVAHVLRFCVLNVVSVRKVAGFVVGIATAKMVGNHTVVLSRVLKRFNHQVVTGFVIGRAVVGLHLGNDGIVVTNVNDDVHVFVVFRRRANHGWAANVDVLDRSRQIAVRICYGAFERVEVDHNHINWCDAVFSHDRVIGAATAQNATVYFRV